MIRFGLNIGIDVERVLFLFALGFLVVGVAMALGRFFGVMLDTDGESPEETFADGATKILGAVIVMVVAVLDAVFGWFPDLFSEVLTTMALICGAIGMIGAWKVKDALALLREKGNSDE